VLVVAACAQTDALLEEPALAQAGLTLERASDSESAIARVERGDAPDVVLLSPRLADPVRVAQRLHSLDRDGAVVVLADARDENDLRHALAVAPFLGGDVSMVPVSDAAALVEALTAAAARSRMRRAAAADRTRRETPPPLSARYLGTLLDSAPIGIVTLDDGRAVIGWNKRAGEMFGVAEVEAVGSSFTELFPADRERLEALIAGLGTSGLDEQGEVFERDGRCFEITGARFAIRSGESGSLLILQDVTTRMAAERELRNTAVTLQESLLPPQLPAIRGLELAARFRPAGGGTEVGGDFYDIFEAAPGQWAIALGDVCGKGAEAAALTALTRYTVRTAAMYEDQPSGVLRVLNQALLRQRGDFRFTTLVFCVVDLSAERPALRASCGGHPRPLLLRPDATAEAVGPPGPLLGVFPDAQFRDEHVRLEPHDVLVLYTDGLTDALAPDRMLDEPALLGELSRCTGLGVGEISQRLEGFALGDESARVPRDDIALVVAKLG
jgi:PAS domain S-box-containing protein